MLALPPREPVLRGRSHVARSRGTSSARRPSLGAGAGGAATGSTRNVTFGYQFARPTKTAFDVYTERQGVCRDFLHLAITFCARLNIPARYATGYLGDIGVPPAADARWTSRAWLEVYLGGAWCTIDARHNQPRIGRVLMARGRDAVDVALTTSFGPTTLTHFSVWTEELPAAV